ncbi:MAG TPA: efflux transporter outer membrane subunit [Acidobacteriaceae bacterium]|nr:efflux transporter outer membrane subunit [Acidobacteriaceae bacterium]
MPFLRTHAITGVPHSCAKRMGGVAMLALTVTLALTGCTVGPKYTRPNVPAPPTFRGPDNTAISSDPKTSIADQQWSTIFHEPELQQLITTALANNLDLRIAAQHILEQQAQVRITRAQEFPQIGGTLSGSGTNVSQFVITAPVEFGLTASWTPDFWGLYRKQTEAQRDQLLAQQWAQRAVRVTLVQQVATTYFQLRALDAQLAVAQQTLKVRQDSLSLTQKLETGGAAPLSDVRQAEQLLYTASSEIPQLEQQIQQTENELRLLLGQTPGPVTHTDPAALTPPPTDLPTGIASQLLERRPDIQQAEAQLMAANANIGVASAQFFPQLSLSGEGGAGGVNFANLIGVVLGTGSITQPIFEGGKLRGQLQLSVAQKDELVLNYQKTILGAFRDVSNSLIAAQKTRDTRIEEEKLVASAQDATRLARDRYNGGATSYLEVLTNDSNLFNAQLSLITAQQNEALTLVQLYTTLGGGWQ